MRVSTNSRPTGGICFRGANPGRGRASSTSSTTSAATATASVYVADRENHRIQLFNEKGGYEGQWNNMHRPCALFMEPKPAGLCFVGELGPFMALNRDHPRLGPRISILSAEGKLVGRLGDNGLGFEPGNFLAPHGITADSRGDLYLGEVANTAWPLMYPDKPRPPNLRVLRKLVREPA